MLSTECCSQQNRAASQKQNLLCFVLIGKQPVRAEDVANLVLRVGGYAVRQKSGLSQMRSRLVLPHRAYTARAARERAESCHSPQILGVRSMPACRYTIVSDHVKT